VMPRRNRDEARRHSLRDEADGCREEAAIARRLPGSSRRVPLARWDGPEAAVAGPLGHARTVTSCGRGRGVRDVTGGPRPRQSRRRSRKVAGHRVLEERVGALLA
jgi:hypothetical protein